MFASKSFHFKKETSSLEVFCTSTHSRPVSAPGRSYIISEIAAPAKDTLGIMKLPPSTAIDVKSFFSFTSQKLNTKQMEEVDSYPLFSLLLRRDLAPEEAYGGVSLEFHVPARNWHADRCVLLPL